MFRIKQSTIIGVLLVVVFVRATTFTAIPTCVSQSHELWPHEDPNYFWYCHTAGSQPVKMPCPEDRGFLRSDTYSGCVPYESWKCTKGSLTPPECRTTKDFNKPHRHPNPNYFWACPEPQGTPGVLLECMAGRGYVENDHNLGCMPYENIDADPDKWTCAEHGNPLRE